PALGPSPQCFKWVERSPSPAVRHLTPSCTGSSKSTCNGVMKMAEATSYEVILSVNGKQTPIAAWTDQGSSDTALEWVRSAFKEMVMAHYALKQELRRSQGNGPYCKEHQLPMVFRSGKYGNFY